MYLLTGASKGIGRHLLERLVETTNEPIVAFYNSTLPDFIHPNVEWCKVDLGSFEETERSIAGIKTPLNQIKFINCAGLSFNAVLHKFPELEWEKLLHVNLTSTFYICKLLLPLMRTEGYGRIVFISSIVAQTGVVGASAYAASKSGLWGLMKTLVQENASKGITCNTLNLGYFDIGLIREVPEKYLEDLKNRIPNKALGNPDDIFKTIQLLMDTTYINGSCIDINGGLY
jgi:acetoacetyl-CoA reductase/3-oxoacyl-[acyl-carrier protein] reductase